MRNPFEHSSAQWVRYSAYEWKTDMNGVLYIAPAADAQPSAYDPLANAEELLLDAVSAGMICLKKDERASRAAIMDFVCKYGLVGFMTALPATPRFIECDAVQLPRNRYIHAQTLPTEDYLAYFFPFEKPVCANIAGQALALSGWPPVPLFEHNYAERYDWLNLLFRAWAVVALAAFLYREDREAAAPVGLYRQAVASLDGMTPCYHIELRDWPTLVWEFGSLLAGVQLLLALALTDEGRPLRLCRHCMRPFFAERRDALYCSPECGSQA